MASMKEPQQVLVLDMIHGQRARARTQRAGLRGSAERNEVLLVLVLVILEGAKGVPRSVGRK